MIEEIKNVTSSKANEDSILPKMLRVKDSLQSKHEGFIIHFLEDRGLYYLQSCLNLPYEKIHL